MSQPVNNSDADRNLLLGILAMQVNFIDHVTLLSAMNAWAADKKKTLGQVLIEQQKLTPGQLDALDALREQQLKLHGGSAELSLHAVQSVSLESTDLISIHDYDVQTSVAKLGFKTTVDETISYRLPPSDQARYQKLRHHADGGLGKVFVADDTELHREVALKEIKPEFADDENSRRRFVLEAEITGSLEHPGIVPVYGLGSYPSGQPYYAMRFIRGDNLKEAIDRFHAADKSPRNHGERSLAFRQLLGRFVDACNAVAYAHSRGVLHRDLKPGNVMLGKFGETLVVDWGLAKSGAKDQRFQSVAEDLEAEPTLRPVSGSSVEPTMAGAVVGTPPYMSPEQAEGRIRDLGPASDIYSLGSTLYVLLTGEKPYAATNKEEVLVQVRRGQFSPPKQVKRNTPATLDAICCKAMSLQPKDRYDTALALASDLEHWLADEPVAAYPEPWTTRVARWTRRHRTAVASAFVFLACAVFGLAVSTVLVSAEQRKTAAQERIAREQSYNIIRLIETSEPEFAMIPALHDRRADLLKTSSEACRQFLRRDPDNLELVQQSARIFRFTANFQRLTNQTAEAESFYKDAIDLNKSLVKAFPKQVEFRLQRSDVHRDYANLLVNVGRLQQAAEHLGEAEAIAEDLTGGDREHPVFRRSLALATLNKARVAYRQGKHQTSPETAADLKRSVDLLRGLVDGPPDRRHPYDPLLLAAALNLTGIVQREVGKFDDAEKSHSAAALLLKEMQDKKSHGVNEADIIHFRAECQIEQAKTWAKIAKPKYLSSAEANMGLAINKLIQLARDYPKIPTYQESLAKAYRERGEVRIQAGNFSGARDHFQIARDLLVSLTRKYEKLPELHAELGKSHAGLGRAALELKDAESEPHYKQAVLEIRKACASSPDDSRFKQWLAELADVRK
ncbi:MAG: protein kinase domain-containing protein [Pirellulaceae bacterium]